MQNNFYIYLAILFFVVLLVAEIAYLVYDPNLWLFMIDKGYRDAVHAALSLGRLDLITTLLAIVTVIFSVFAIIGFGYVKARSEQIAKEAGEEVAEKVALRLSREVNEKLEKVMDDAKSNYRDLLRKIGELHGINDLVEAVTEEHMDVRNKSASDAVFKTSKQTIQIIGSDDNH